MAMRKIKPNATIQALTLPPTAEKTDVLLLIAEQNSFRDKLSQAEQASFFKAYLEQKPLAEALPLLEKFGYKPQKHVLQSLLDLLKLDKSALIAVHEGTIALKAAPKLLKLASPDQKLLVEIIKSLHLGGSKQQKLLDYCTELLMRTNEPLSTLLTPFFEGDKLADTDNIPQKAGALITWLHKKCYPRSTVAEEEFKTSVNKLNLPNHIQLDHTPSFEDDKVILSVSFQNLQEAANSLSQLQNTPGKTSN